MPIFEHAWAHFTYTSSDGQNGGPPPISDGLDALFRGKSLRWPPGRPSRATKPSIPVDAHVRVSRPPKKMLSITYFLTLFEPARVPPRPLVHPWILIAVRERWDGLSGIASRLRARLRSAKYRREGPPASRIRGRKSFGAFPEIAHKL